MTAFKFDPNDNSFRRHVNFMYGGNLEDPDYFEELKSEWGGYIDKPPCIPLAAVREGTYAIREKGFVQEVEYAFGKWIKKGKWPQDFSIHQWNLFPQLPDKEYESMWKIPHNRFSKEWQDNIRAYFRWKELRNMTRDTRKFMMEFNKKK